MQGASKITPAEHGVVLLVSERIGQAANFLLPIRATLSETLKVLSVRIQEEPDNGAIRAMANLCDSASEMISWHRVIMGEDPDAQDKVLDPGSIMVEGSDKIQ
jgi:hypothetical protein